MLTVCAVGMAAQTRFEQWMERKIFRTVDDSTTRRGIIAADSVFGIRKQAVESSWIIVPYPSYAPETSWRIGVTCGIYFKSPNPMRISYLNMTGEYSVLKQFKFMATSTAYMGRNQEFSLETQLDIRLFPDYYYGIRNTYDGLRFRYSDRRSMLDMTLQYEAKKNIKFGGHLFLRYADPKSLSGDDDLADSLRIVGSNEVGWYRHFQTGIGLTFTYDSRDNQFYATRGIYARTDFGYYLPYLSRYQYARGIIDYRQYQTLWKNHVLAWQVYSEMTLSNEAPFYEIPTLGGDERMRGFRQNMFRNPFLWCAQVEYRIPLWWRFKAVAFATVGDCYSWKDFMHSKSLKSSVGIGLRFRFNEAKSHFRFDVAKNNYEQRISFYITAIEAF